MTKNFAKHKQMGTVSQACSTLEANPSLATVKNQDQWKTASGIHTYLLCDHWVCVFFKGVAAQGWDWACGNLSHSKRSFLRPVQSQLTLWLVGLSPLSGDIARDVAHASPWACADFRQPQDLCTGHFKPLLNFLSENCPTRWDPQIKQAQTMSCHISRTSRGPHHSCQIHGLNSLDLLLAWLISLQEWIKGKNCWRLKRSPEEVISDETEVCLVPANPPSRNKVCWSHHEYSVSNWDKTWCERTNSKF